MLVIEVAGGSYVPVGLAFVPANEHGEPDVLLRRSKMTFGCGHSYWVLFAPDASVFVEVLDNYVLWRGGYSRVGESVVEWFLHKVHGGTIH